MRSRALLASHAGGATGRGVGAGAVVLSVGAAR
jgi:hypothetical protein